MAVQAKPGVQERILLHLLDYSDFKDSIEVPFALSQMGIANAVGSREMMPVQPGQRIDVSPPASSSSTDAPSADSRFASTQPAEPAPTTT